MIRGKFTNFQKFLQFGDTRSDGTLITLSNSDKVCNF